MYTFGVSELKSDHVFAGRVNRFFSDDGVLGRSDPRAVLAVLGVLTVTFVLVAWVVLFGVLAVLSPLQQDPQSDIELTDTQTSTTSAPSEIDAFNFLVGEPLFYPEPTWGISGEPTVAVPVIAENTTEENYTVSPTKCFTLTQSGDALAQIFPLAGNVSVGGIIPAKGVQLGWLYFEGVDPAEPMLFSAQCEPNHEGFYHTITPAP